MKTLLTVLLPILISASAISGQTVNFKLTTQTYSGYFAPANCLAVWVTDQNDNYIKSLLIRGSLNYPPWYEYRNMLVKWVTVSNYDSTDAITGASRTQHGPEWINWDGTDINGNNVQNGQYKLWIEMQENNVPDNDRGNQSYWGPNTAVNFTVSQSHDTVRPPDVTFKSRTVFTAMELIFTSPAADVEPPELKTANGEPDRILLVFNEPVAAGSAENPLNYTLAAGFSVTSAQLSTDGRRVTLGISPPMETGLTYSVTANNITDRAAPPNVLAPNSRVLFTVPSSLLLCDFGKSPGEDRFSLTGWQTVIKDNYTGHVDKGPGGTAITTGNNPSYNYQGITGQSRAFQSGEKIKVSWYNSAASPVTFTPKISFNDPDRPIAGTGGNWHDLPAISIGANTGASHTFEITSGTAGSYTLVNINNNLQNSGTLVCDKLELVPFQPTVPVTRLSDAFRHMNFQLSPSVMSGSTQMTFTASAHSAVNLHVFNSTGSRISNVPLGRKGPGRHYFTWQTGQLPPGLYFFRLSMGKGTSTLKGIILK